MNKLYSWLFFKSLIKYNAKILGHRLSSSVFYRACQRRQSSSRKGGHYVHILLHCWKGGHYVHILLHCWNGGHYVHSLSHFGTGGHYVHILSHSSKGGHYVNIWSHSSAHCITLQKRWALCAHFIIAEKVGIMCTFYHFEEHVAILCTFFLKVGNGITVCAHFIKLYIEKVGIMWKFITLYSWKRGHYVHILSHSKGGHYFFLYILCRFGGNWADGLMLINPGQYFTVFLKQIFHWLVARLK